jgi:RNA polymerase sigma-70 factor (ECF subfamily)
MFVLPLQFGALPLGRIVSPGPSAGRGFSGRGAGEPLHARTRARGTDIIHPEQPVKNRTDEALLGDYVDGDRAAFRELLGRYRDELLHFLTRFLGSRAAAEDVFQETFLQIHLSAEAFDTSRRLKPWLFTIAANKARDYHRKHGRRQGVSLSASISGDGDGQTYVDLMETDVPGPDAPILDAERSRLVKGVVDSLSPHLREILLLSYFQRMSYTQIAETLEIPLGTVKSRLHTAVATFARSWSAALAGNQAGADTAPDERQDGN